MFHHLVLWLAILASLNTSLRAATQPNIIVILADDLGWRDLRVIGAADLKTPALDALARNGVRCTSGYVTAPICSPSRAALMTGRYQQRFGHETNPGLSLERHPIFGLPLTESTIGNRFKELGYATGWIGKSHLGGVTNLYHPRLRGFDEFFGFIESHHSYFDTNNYSGGLAAGLAAQADPILRGFNPVRETNYLTYAFGRECTNFIARHAGEPFFLYAPFNAMHFPMEATASLFARFTPADFGNNLNRYTNAAMLAGLDDAVSSIVAQLRALHLDTNTLLFFTSDNGGATNLGSINLPLRGTKTDLYEGGIRVPFLIAWPGHLPTNQVYTHAVSTLDILPTAIAAAGGTVPDAWQLDGVNLLPYLLNPGPGMPHPRLFWRVETDGINPANDDDVKDGERAVLEGTWKLVKPGVEQTWELYDLSIDPGESNDLAAQRPEIVQRLVTSYDEWNAQMSRPLWSRNKLRFATPEFVLDDIRLGATNSAHVATEFVPGGTLMVSADGQFNLWAGEIDLHTGHPRSGTGLDLQIASNASAPQWGLSTNGPTLFYTKPSNGAHLQLWRARLPDQSVTTEQLTSSSTEHSFGARPSQDAASDSVNLAFNRGTVGTPVASWANELAPSAVTALPGHAGGSANGNWLPGGTEIVYSSLNPTSLLTQIARYDTVTRTARIVTDDDGEKSDAWGFLAPEFNNELCVATVVDHTTIAIYADLHDNTNGILRRIASVGPPASSTQHFIHSMQPLSGLRGFNGVSYFTAAVFENNDPDNPIDSGIWLFGLGPNTNNALVRRIDAGAATNGRVAGRREPRTLTGQREVFCYYLGNDGVTTQLRLAKTGLNRPDHPGASAGFTDLHFHPSYTAGTTDPAGRRTGGTELTHLVSHEGKLYAGIGSRGQPIPTDTNNIPDNWTGAQILVKNSPTEPWRVDPLTPPIFRAHMNVDALDTITFTTRANGTPLPNPVTLLVAGLSDISNAGADLASVRTRLPGSADGWEHSTVATSTIPAHVISFGSHVDGSSGVSLIFAGLANGEIYRGVLNSNATGNLSWIPGAELNGGGPVTAFARCNGFLYAVSTLRQNSSNAPVNGGLFVRIDSSNTWRRVYRWSAPARTFSASLDDRTALGLATAPDPDGSGNRILLLARSWPGVIERIDPTGDHAVKVELDVRDFFARHWNDDRVRNQSVTIAYTGFTAATNPVTGEAVQLVGVRIEHPDPDSQAHRGSHFLIRHGDGTYEAADIPNEIAGTELHGTRCVAVSPFTAVRSAAFYFGGYDVGAAASTNTAWVMRGDWIAWPSLTLTRPNPPDWQLAWPIAETNWLLESTSDFSSITSWQAVLGQPTRSRTNETLSVSPQTQSSLYRLRLP